LLSREAVAAFRPTTGSDRPDAGLFLIRGIDESSIGESLSKLIGDDGAAKIVEREYQGFRYRVVSRDGKIDVILIDGDTAVIGDKESVIRESIDARRTGRSWASTRAVVDGVRSIPTNTSMHLVVSAAAIKPLVAQSLVPKDESETKLRRMVLDAWDLLEWTSLSATLDDRWNLEWRYGLRDLKSNGRQQAEPELWKRLPASTWGAIAFPFESERIVATIEEMTPGDEKGKLEDLVRLVNQMLVGYDWKQDLLPRLGKELGAAVIGPDELSSLPRAVGLLRFDAEAGDKAGFVSLTDALEQAIRPVIVVALVEHNRQNDDQATLRTRVDREVRFHETIGSKKLPLWIVPSFAVNKQSLSIASHPSALTALMGKPTTPRFSESKLAAKVVDQVGDGVPIGFVDVAAVRKWLTFNRTAFTETAMEADRRKFDRLLELLSIADLATIGRVADERSTGLRLTLGVVQQ
jgi:hypothetical protein